MSLSNVPNIVYWSEDYEGSDKLRRLKRLSVSGPRSGDADGGSDWYPLSPLLRLGSLLSIKFASPSENLKLKLRSVVQFDSESLNVSGPRSVAGATSDRRLLSPSLRLGSTFSVTLPTSSVSQLHAPGQLPIKLVQRI